MTNLEDTLRDREVRLFPSHHIAGLREAELRAAAALLAVTRAVSEFGGFVVSLAGGPKGKVQTYTEVSFKTGSPPKEKDVRPDGLVRVQRGKRDWKALVEVKVGDGPIEQEQFDTYHRLAKDEEIDAVITVSNQAALPNGLPPVSVDRRRLRKVPVTHISWERLLSEARLLSKRKEVADPDQSWMLEEWIRYLADPVSRIIDPPNLGDRWKEILRAAREANLPAVSREMRRVVERWDAFLRKVAMRLRAKLGVDVQPLVPRSEKADPEHRLRRLHTEAMSSGELLGQFRIPDAVGTLSVTVVLAAKSVRYAVQLRPPTEGRQKTRLTWLTRQLKSADVPGDLVVKVRWDKGRQQSQARLSQITTGPEALLLDGSRQPIQSDSMPRSYSLEKTLALPKGRGRSTAPVLEGIATGLISFYRSVVQDLRPYVPRAPRLAPTEKEPSDHASERVPDQPEPVAAPTAVTRIPPMPGTGLVQRSLAAPVEVEKESGPAPSKDLARHDEDG